MVHADPDVSVAVIIEAIHGFTNYRVKYGKAWRAKQHAIAMLWRDWKEAYGRVPKILNAIAHFNPGTKWCIHSTGRQEMHKGSMRPVMKRAYWCFPQCVEAFKHCKPIISVDSTFLIGKYHGALLIATGMDGEDRLIPLAFSLIEGENNDSWSWFLHLVRRDVVGQDRKVCIISDRHQGILNAVEDHMEGYHPIMHRWCMRHFAANIWQRQKEQESYKAAKVVMRIKDGEDICY